MPRLRQNIVTKEWVVIAPGRSKRPQDFVQAASSKRSNKKECPFCLENEDAYRFSIEEFETDNVYVIPNKYPAFVLEDEVTQKEGDRYPSYKSLGGHDVIIMKDHDKEMWDYKKGVLEEYYYVYQRRINHFNANPAVEYSMIIHNFGPKAGASIEHPHSQLMASALLPSRIELELSGSQDFYKENKKCVFCWLVEQEQEKQVRVVGENDQFIAFTYWAARFPFETWIVPKNHQPFFEKINRSQRLALADVFLQVLNKLNDSLNMPSYNYYIHTAPPRTEGRGKIEDYYHWHIEIAPRVNTFGGYELGSGMVIDVISPERAARYLNNNTDKKEEKTYA